MVSEDKQQILDIKVKYEDAIYGIIRYKEKIDQLKQSIKDLQQQEKDKTITTNEMKVQTEAINATIKEYQYNVRALQKEIQNNVRTENEQEGSLKQLRAQLSNATKKYDEMAKAEREGAKGQALAKHINEITEKLKLAEEQTQRYYRNVGNYYNSMLDLAADLQHVVPMGGGGGVGEGINSFANTVVNLGKNVKDIIPNVKAFGSTLLGLATNPVFLGLAGVAGAGMAFKWWFDYNKGLMEATRLTREFTGYTGEALETMRNSIAATADTMGKDFKDVLGTADNIMANFHLSGEQAMDVINKGFASGADLSGDMLQKIQQYAPTFHDAGISADQMVAIIQQTRSGIFSDKGLDIIDMASKKIREMSSGTASSLDAIGISSKQVQEDLAKGTKSTFDVIQEVSTKMKNFGADSQQVGDVLKNVFGKQGAQAGIQLIEQLDTMSTSLDEVKKQTGAWGDVQLENIKIQKELKSYTSALFDFTQQGFASIITAGKQFGSKVLIAILKGVMGLTNACIALFHSVVGAAKGIYNSFGDLWKMIKNVGMLVLNAFKQMGRSATGFLKIMEGIVTFNFSKAKEGFREMFDGSWLKNDWAKIKVAGSNAGKAFVSAFDKEMMSAKFLKPADKDGGATSSEPTNGNKGTTPAAAKGSIAKTKAQRAKEKAEAKAEAERRKKQEKELQAQIALIQYKYNEQVMDAKKRYLAGMYDNERDYSNDLEQLEKDMVARSIDAYVAAGEIGAEKAQEMQAKLLDIMIKAKEDIKNQAKEIVDEINKEFEEAEKKRRDADIMNGGTGEEDDAAKLDRYKAFLEQKLAMTQENVEAQKQLQQELHDTTLQLQADENKNKQQKLQEQNQMIADYILAIGDGLAAFFESQDLTFHNFLKTMLTTYLDAIEKQMTATYVEILANSIAKSGWAGVASAAAKLALIKAAFAAAKAAVKGFSTGGYVQGSGTGTSDSIPARLSNGESVMTAKATSMFSPILSAFNQLGGGVPIVVNNGGSNIGMDMLAAAVARGYQMAPQPVVSVEEINRTQRRVQTIENIGRLQ
jgi:hypothetical protein